MSPSSLSSLTSSAPASAGAKPAAGANPLLHKVVDDECEFDMGHCIAYKPGADAKLGGQSSGKPTVQPALYTMPPTSATPTGLSTLTGSALVHSI